jgi:O-antigen/teichoic acid export membrane protein
LTEPASGGTPRRSVLIAGLLDSATASLATFVVGVFAARTLEASVLGAYALAYGAIFLVGMIPTNLIFTPIEVEVVKRPRDQRLGYLLHGLRVGFPLALLCALGVAAWVFFAPSNLDPAAIRALTITSIAVAFASPLQDHVRRMLHTGGASGRAALVSSVQLVVAVGALVLGHLAEIPTAWLPFGALAAANMASLTVGALTAVGTSTSETFEGLRFPDLVRSGSWLVGSGSLAPLSGFIASAMVANLASAEALGHAEAARIVAQPVWVLAVGLSAVLGPRSIEAAQKRDHRAARHVSRIFSIALALLGFASVLWFGFAWVGNPFYQLVPVAYAVSGLVVFTILAELPRAWAFPFRSEVLGGGRERDLLAVEGGGALFKLAAGGGAPFVGAFAIPLGLLGMGFVRLVSCAAIARSIYDGGKAAPGA